MLGFISDLMREHSRFWLFVMMQLSVMLSMVDIVIKIDQSPGLAKPVAWAHLNYELGELAYSPLFSGFAMGAIHYGYGLVYLRFNGRFGAFPNRFHKASMSVWERCSPMIVLPWLLKVGEGLFRQPFYQLEDVPATFSEADNYTLITMVAICFWYCVIFLALGSLYMAIRFNRQLIRFRHVRFDETELYEYARRINELAGFEIIFIGTLNEGRIII